jgi:hypothetical protein
MEVSASARIADRHWPRGASHPRTRRVVSTGDGNPVRAPDPLRGVLGGDDGCERQRLGRAQVAPTEGLPERRMPFEHGEEPAAAAVRARVDPQHLGDEIAEAHVARGLVDLALPGPREQVRLRLLDTGDHSSGAAHGVAGPHGEIPEDVFLGGSRLQAVPVRAEEPLHPAPLLVVPPEALPPLRA